MGTDIRGWVEVRSRYSRTWEGVVKIDHLVTGSDAFGCLFGVSNMANFRPLAPDRGFPSDVSEEVTTDFTEWESEATTLGYTWISWKEIQTLDGDEQALDVDRRVDRYRRHADGSLEPAGKGFWRSTAAHVEAGDFTWEEEGYVYRRETLSRKDALAGDWQTLFAIMGLLATDRDEDDVRLVVWFDR